MLRMPPFSPSLADENVRCRWDGDRGGLLVAALEPAIPPQIYIGRAHHLTEPAAHYTRCTMHVAIPAQIYIGRAGRVCCMLYTVHTAHSAAELAVYNIDIGGRCENGPSKLDCLGTTVGKVVSKVVLAQVLDSTSANRTTNWKAGSVGQIEQVVF